MKKLLFVLIFLLLIPIALAHEGEGQLAGRYRIEFLSERESTTGVDTNLEFRIEDASTNQTLSGLQAYIVFEPNTRLDLTERSGVYYTNYNFKKPDLYEAHEFFINGERLSVDFHITVSGQNYETDYVYYIIPIL